MKKDQIAATTYSVFNSATDELVQGSQNSSAVGADILITQLETDSKSGEEFYAKPYNPETDLVSEEILAVTIAA